MKTSKLIQLLVILLAGILLIYGRKIYLEKQANKPNDYLKNISSFKKDQVDQIRLSQGDQNLLLTKNGQEWKIASISADLTKVQDLLNAVFPETSPNLIAQSKDQMTKLQVEGDKSIKLELTAGDKTLKLSLGKQISQDRAVKLADIESVYSLRSFPDISLSENDWYNLKIVDLDKNQIKSIQLKSADENIEFNKSNDNKWQFTDKSDDKVNQDAVNSLLMNLNPLKAKKVLFADDLKSFNSQNTVLTINLQTVDGRNIELKFFASFNGEDFMVSKNGSQNYSITKYLMENLQKKRDSFLLSN